MDSPSPKMFAKGLPPSNNFSIFCSSSHSRSIPVGSALMKLSLLHLSWVNSKYIEKGGGRDHSSKHTIALLPLPLRKQIRNVEVERPIDFARLQANPSPWERKLTPRIDLACNDMTWWQHAISKQRWKMHFKTSHITSNNSSQTVLFEGRFWGIWLYLEFRY